MKLLWSYIDKSNPRRWKSLGLYDNGFYYSNTKLILKFRIKHYGT